MTAPGIGNVNGERKWENFPEVESYNEYNYNEWNTFEIHWMYIVDIA